MFVLKSNTGYFAGAGTGFVISPPPDVEVFYMEIPLATYQSLVTSVPGWAGDPRFVTLDENGIPNGYVPRELSPEEAAQDLQAYLAEMKELSAIAAENIPGWATWTMAETVSYINKNVTDLASAKVVLVAMAQMLVTLRNYAFPHLENSN